MEKCYKIKTTQIEYYVSAEDIDLPDPFESYGRVDLEEYSEEEIEDMIDEVKMCLPQTLILEVECEPEDLEDCIEDAISDETGWLVEYFSYEILEEEIKND